MYDAKSLQDFEEGGNNCLKCLMAAVRKVEHNKAKGETERQVGGYCCCHLRDYGSSDHSTLRG